MVLTWSVVLLVSAVLLLAMAAILYLRSKCGARGKQFSTTASIETETPIVVVTTTPSQEGPAEDRPTEVPGAAHELPEEHTVSEGELECCPRHEGGEPFSIEPVPSDIRPSSEEDETQREPQVPQEHPEAAAQAPAGTGGDVPLPAGESIALEAALARDVRSPATEGARAETHAGGDISQEVGEKLVGELAGEAAVLERSNGAEKPTLIGTAGRGKGEDVTVQTATLTEMGQEATPVGGDVVDRPAMAPREKKRARVLPVDRGGRPRASESRREANKETAAVAEQPGLRAEIVCCNAGRL